MAAHKVVEGYHRPLFLQTPNTWESLRATEGVILRPVDKALRNPQVYPTAVRESDQFNEIRRTAHIKHPLRPKCATPDKSTTYEHDFRPIAILPRVPTISAPKEKPAVPSIPQPQDQEGEHPDRPASSASVAPPPRPASSASVDPPGSARSARSAQSERSRSVRSSGRYSARDDRRHPARRSGTPALMQLGYRDMQPGLPDTLSVLNQLSRATKAMRVTTAGWGDAQAMKQILGQSDRQVHLIQTIHAMKLRSPDTTNLIRD